ncbi:MAG: hypothetical protein Devi2KO_40510 [Devosia indica]
MVSERGQGEERELDLRKNGPDFIYMCVSVVKSGDVSLQTYIYMHKQWWMMKWQS